MLGKIGYAWSCSMLALIAFGAESARAQSVPAQPAPEAPHSTGDTRLEDIIVTAQRRDAPAQDVPIAVTTLSEARIQNAGIVSSYDLRSVASGLSTGQNVSGFQPFLRGVGTTFFGPGIENPVALYVDDVYYSSQLLAPTDLSGLGSISVLKGPQGTLFGRNSTGGVVQMATRAPGDSFAAEFRTELDNYLTTRSMAYVNGGLAPNLAANLTLQYAHQGEGYGKDIVTGDDVHKIDHDLAVRTRLLWTPGEDTRIGLNLDYAYRRNSLGPNFTLYRKAPIPAIAPFLPSSNVYDVDNVPQTDNRLNTGGASLKVEQKLGFATAVSITAYRRYSFSAFYDTDALPVLGSNSRYKPIGTQFSQELQLVSKDNDAFNWVIGGFYFNSEDKLNGSYLGFNDGSDGLGGNQLVNFSGYNAEFFPYKSFFIYYPDTKLTTESGAVFGEATYRFAERTRLTLGGRWTKEKRKIRGTPESWAAEPLTQNIADGFKLGNLYDNPATAAIEGRIDNSLSASQFTYRAILDHKFTDRVMVYASFNRGFKSGGFNAYYTAPIGDPERRDQPFRPEKLNAYEVGLKSEFFGRSLRLNPSFFYYDYKDLQVLSLIDSAIVTTNAKSARLYGLDLDTSWQPLPQLTFNAGLLWMHARYKTFNPAPIYTVLPSGVGLQQPFQGDASGNQLPFAPDVSFNVSADYRLPLRDGSRLNFNLTYSFSQGYPFEPDNNVKLNDFHLLNGAIRWESPNRNVSFGIFARNILDTHIPGSVSATPPIGYVADYSNPPRTFGGTAVFKFGK